MISFDPEEIRMLAGLGQLMWEYPISADEISECGHDEMVGIMGRITVSPTLESRFPNPIDVNILLVSPSACPIGLCSCRIFSKRVTVNMFVTGMETSPVQPTTIEEPFCRNACASSGRLKVLHPISKTRLPGSVPFMAVMSPGWIEK